MPARNFATDLPVQIHRPIPNETDACCVTEPDFCSGFGCMGCMSLQRERRGFRAIP
jgi:hypothetical protein